MLLTAYYMCIHIEISCSLEPLTTRLVPKIRHGGYSKDTSFLGRECWTKLLVDISHKDLQFALRQKIATCKFFDELFAGNDSLQNANV